MTPSSSSTSSTLGPPKPPIPWLVPSASPQPPSSSIPLASLREREIQHSPLAPAPAMYYNFVPGGSYHCSPPAPYYYPTYDYYPLPLPPPPSHAFVQSSNQPLPRAPPSLPDYWVAHPPLSPLVRAYGNYHHDCNSNASFVEAHSQFVVGKTLEGAGSGGVGGYGRRG